ncbi:transcriptional regulator ATRX homolog [Drosophila eugracilis]|uniref:transcriptional regulator ATRX homolog n=1 Tax=Drosophila eugracilis TaxID=29029 RepID=UPI0007E5C435|nr:transcriptional regulator ATRX homolog [Drosophila eugracilis]
MRSRTELVTTTFEESDEDDFSPDDDSDSEEDWRPTKKRPSKPSGSDGGRKRKSAAAANASKAKRRMAKVSDEESDEEDDLETDPSDDDFDYPSASTSKRPQSLPPKKQFVKLNQLDLLVKKADLLENDWLKNNRLCLWRKDEQTNLLQKYLRVKSASEEEELLFTSSSVYSSWDDQQTSDFIEVKVNCLDPNNRRIKLHDLEAVKKISEELRTERDKHSASDKEDASEAEEEKPDDADP